MEPQWTPEQERRITQIVEHQLQINEMNNRKKRTAFSWTFNSWLKNVIISAMIEIVGYKIPELFDRLMRRFRR